MNSSQNSKKHHSNKKKESRGQHREVFEKFDTNYDLLITTEFRDEWKQVLKDKDGNIIDPNDEEQVDKYSKDAEVSIAWEKTGKRVQCSYVESVLVQDPDDYYTPEPKPVKLLSTPDGPVMGVIIDEDDEQYSLLDPCVVQFKNNRIQLFPIFNVARTLSLKKHAVKSEQVPDKVLIGCYPGFVVQNKMMKYQLKANVPMASSPEIDNEAKDPVSAETKPN